ncbi:MAG: tetratricopeptide repeat protein, partial [Litorilinea sp.]
SGADSSIDALPAQAASGGAAAPAEAVARADTSLQVARTLPADTARALDEGLQRLREGDLDFARTRLETILASDVAAHVKLAARFHLARADLSEDDYSTALTQLEQLQTEYAADNAEQPADVTAALYETYHQSLFLRGQALAQLSRPREAIDAYLAFLEAFPGMASAVEPRLARVYLALGDRNNAAGAYRRAADATVGVSDRVYVLELLAQVYRDAGNHTVAVATYDEILAQAEQPNYRAQIQLRAAQTFADAGDTEQAIDRWIAVTEEAPETTTAHQALVQLVNRQVPFDLYRRGAINLAVGSYFPAINAYLAFLEEVPAADPRAGPARHQLGQAYLGAQDYAAAITEFNQVITDYPDCDCFGQAHLDLGWTRAMQGDGVGAKRAYRTFARDHGDDPLAPEGMWRSGLLSLNQGNLTEAAADFLVLADSFPTSERTPQALYAVGMGAFREEIYDQSAFAFARLQNGYPDYRWDSVAYWQGRAYRANGQDGEADAQFRRIVARAPDVYYGILAAYELNRTPMTDGAMLTRIAEVAGPRTQAAGDDGSQEFAQRWLADWLQVDAATLPTLPAAVAQDPDLAVGRMLLTLGERGEGLAALERVYQRHRNDPRSLYAMSLAFEEMDAYRLSLIAMARLIPLSPAALVEDAPVFMQEKAYPQRFDNLITPQAQAHNLNPLLFFSLIRQESLFEEGARSHAAAQGLAQIIPDTGQWVADRLSYPGYTNAMVYRPMVNVRFGAYYLDWVRGYLDDNLVSALVGYNAGPGNSERWRTFPQADDDTIFVEILEFTEPRIYVQTILSALYHYTRLYGDG